MGKGWCIVRNGSLWSSVVFEKEVNFPEFDFKTSDLSRNQPSKFTQLRVTRETVFSFVIISQLRRPIELNFSQVCYFVHMLRYSEKTGLWQLPIVSSVFYRRPLHNIWKHARPFPNPVGKTLHELINVPRVFKILHYILHIYPMLKTFLSHRQDYTRILCHA